MLASRANYEGEGPGGIYMVDVIVRKASLLERYFPGIHEGATVIPADVYNLAEPSRARGCKDTDRRR